MPGEGPRRRARSSESVQRKQIGAAVKRAREAALLTQTQLGDRIGASLNAISEIERGITVPSLTTAWSIAEALGLTLDEVVGRHAEPPTTDPWSQIAQLQRQIDELRTQLQGRLAKPPGSERSHS